MGVLCCFDDIMHSMALVAGTIVILAASFLLARFVFVPMRYADDKLVFWDSPAYDDFYDHEYWTESLVYVAVFWGTIALCFCLLAIANRFLRGSWWCLRACSKNSSDTPREVGVAGAPSTTNVYIALGERGPGPNDGDVAAQISASGGFPPPNGGGGGDSVARAVSQIAAPVPFEEQRRRAEAVEIELGTIPAFPDDRLRRSGADRGFSVESDRVAVPFNEVSDFGDSAVNEIIREGSMLELALG